MARSTTLKARAHRRKDDGLVRTYRSALAFLNSTIDVEKLPRPTYTPQLFNLSRMLRLLSKVGNPHRKLRTVHIAGTKGKGSTAAMLSSMLRSCGYKVGLYSSPHLVDLRERISVDGVLISESELTKLVAEVAAASKKLRADTPTFFELMTVIAFKHFVNKKVDLAVVEVGLGGRLDSTNVIKPEVCGITSISLDHTRLLGNTLAQIAEEKAGIFKPGVPVISAPQTRDVKKTLQRIAQRNNVPIRFAGEDIEFSYRFESSRLAGPHTRVSVSTPTSRFEHLHVPLLGEHQAINCGVALGIMAALKERGFAIDELRAIDGLSKVRLPGRMEMISTEPRIMVDGAHNAASVQALMRAIGQNIPYDSMVVIFGCQADKDYVRMLRHIQLGADKVIFTSTGHPRGADPADLLSCFSEMSGKMAQMTPTLQEALDVASRAVGREDLICVTGSFYLVGLAKRLVQKA